MRAVFYARVSTRNGQDPTLQLHDLREYCQRRGWEIAGEYIDLGVSGSKETRPELNQLMTAAKQRKFDAVLVWKLDRFGRSLRHLVNSLAEFEALGIAFVSLHESLDLTTPGGRLQFQIIAAMAEFERALIQERVRGGLAHARRKGKRLGRPRRVWSGKLVKQITGLRSTGRSWQAVARETGIAVGTLYAKFGKELRSDALAVTRQSGPAAFGGLSTK